MFGIFRAIGNGFKKLFGLMMPMFAKAKDVRSIGRKLRWVLHFTFLILVLVGLGYLNYAFELDKLLTAPFPILRKIWLPILFFIVYLLSWLGWWLWRLLAAEEESSDHPDIDSAWEESVAALQAANLSIAETPLFIVLGHPDGGFQSFFAGAQMTMTVEHIPAAGDAPIRLYANEDGIFVTCADVTMLGKLIETLDDSGGRPGSRSRSKRQAKNGGGEMTGAYNASEESEGGEEEQGGESPVSTIVRRPQVRTQSPSLLKDTATVELQAARLRHLCWRILKERRPYCPLNGILLLVPFAATRDEATANQAGLVCHRDLVILKQVLQVNCPIFALVCDMERTTGFREFIDRFPRGHRRRRLGQQFPYLPDTERHELPHVITQGVTWITDSLFPPLIYRLMRCEKSSRDKQAAILRGNIRLYYLYEHIRERRKHLARLLTLAFSDASVPALFGGCYFAATGTNPDHQQAFIPAALHRLLENQNYVSWTSDARSSERDYRRWTRYGYVALGTFLVTFIGILGYFAFR